MGIKQRAMRSLLGSDAVDGLTRSLAEAENELLEAAATLESAHGIDGLGDIPEIDERQDALKGLIEALTAGDFESDWLTDVAPELFDTTDGIERYLGMDADEWEAQIERWAEAYRDSGAEGSNRALAETHVREKWGVDLDTFEERVINWDRGKEAERLFAGNFRAARDAMYRAAAEARGGEK